MVECWLPYGNTEVHISVPLRYLMGTLEPTSNNIVDNPFQTIADSIQNPIGTPALNEQIKSYSKISVAIDGAIHSHLLANTLSAVVWTLNQAGATSENITIVIANGHRGSANPQLTEMLRGLELLKNTVIVDHNKNSTDLEQMGTTSSGTVLEMNKSFTGANYKIAVGPIIPDPFSGLKGAQSTILPGLTSLTSYEKNRSLAFDAKVVIGSIDDNPVYSDQVEAFDMANIDLAVNLATDQKGGLVSASSGILEESSKKAIENANDAFRLKAEEGADIIVISAGGSGYDIDLYNSVWTLKNIIDIAKRGAVIILLAECTEGLGADGLYSLANVDTLNELRRRYTIGAGAVYLIKSMLRRNEIILVSDLPGYLAEPLGLTVERTASEAFENVIKRRRSRKTLVITHGCSTMISLS